MESFEKEDNLKKQELDVCHHIKQKYYNSYILNLPNKTINQEDKNKNKKVHLPNFYNLKKATDIHKSLTNNQVNNHLDKFFIKNLSLNWMALYNPQNISLNSINREGCIFTISFNETGEILASSNHIHNIEIWDMKERKVKKVITDHKEIVTGIEFFNRPCTNKFGFNVKNKLDSDLKNLQFDEKYLQGVENINDEENFNFEQKGNFEMINQTDYSDSNNISNNPSEIDDNFIDEINDSNNENTYMMSCSLDKSIKLWKDFECINTFTDHNDWVRCLSISNDNKFFLSGCVSSVIKYWDLNQKKVLYSFNNSNENPDLLNTVNSLNFMANDSNVYMTGLRSGSVKLFDVRKSNKLIREFKAHKFKLNSVKFNQDNKYLLSSGRDSVARLWDFRNLPSSDNPDKNLSYAVNEYKGHKCQGYNIDCNFFCNENYIITGSEDSNIYIYDTISSDLVVKYKTHQKCVNLVKPSPNLTPYSFAYTGLEDMSIYIWDVTKNISKFIDRNYCLKRENVEKELDKDDEYSEYIENQDKDTTQQKYVQLIEEIMSECGDMILKIFHSNNLTYSNGMNFENLLDIIHKKNDQEHIKIINMLNDKFMKRICESWLSEGINPMTSNKKSSKNDKNSTKNSNNQYKNKVKIECLLCSSLKNNKENNLNFQNNHTNSYLEEYIDDYDFEDLDFSNNIFDKNSKLDNSNGKCMDLSEKNFENRVYFYDKKNYYNYNQSDIKDILSFPNINNSFSLMENNEMLIKKFDETNEKERGNLIKFDVFDNLFRANIKYKMN